jgi:hypothetical protein
MARIILREMGGSAVVVVRPGPSVAQGRNRALLRVLVRCRVRPHWRRPVKIWSLHRASLTGLIRWLGLWT